MGIRDYHKKIRELEEFNRKYPSRGPSVGETLNDLARDLLTLLFAVSMIGLGIGVSYETYQKRKLLHRGELVHEEKYVVKGKSPSDFWKKYTISANQVGKDKLVFFEPYGKLESIIESGDTLTLRFSDRQWKYLNDKGEVPIKDRNLRYVNGKSF